MSWYGPCHQGRDPQDPAACTLPLAGRRVVDLVITDLGVLEVDRKAGGMRLIELAPGVALDELIASTGAPFAHEGRIQQAGAA